MIAHKSNRLTKIAELIKAGSRVADIGCDHGYLALYLAKSQKCKNIIATDLNEMPLKKAINNFKRFGVLGKIETRLGSGVMPIESPEADVVIVAGMGGELISSIIEEGKANGRVFEKYILQPMSRAEVLRKYLCENGFKIDNEHLLSEKGRIYSIMEVSIGKDDSCICDYYLTRHILKNKEFAAKYTDKYIKIFSDILKSNESAQIRELVLKLKEEKNKISKEDANEMQ